jgi:RNA polymerase sigma-70 factor (ECF subfamily)
MSDEEMVKRCLRQDAEAQRALYDRFARQMMAVCMRYAGNPMEAQDMLQEGFIKVFEKLGQFRGEGVLAGWVRRIMVNEALIYLRKNKKHQFIDEINDDHEMGHEGVDALETLAVEALLALIAGLPSGYRTVFNLFAVEGYTHKEIAEMLDITESTSKTQFHKAKKQLREQLERIEERRE